MRSTTALVARITISVIFVFPPWAIAVLTLDLLVLYALLTQGADSD